MLTPFKKKTMPNAHYRCLMAALGSAIIALSATTPPTQGLVGYWKLDATSGVTVADSSGQNNHGTLKTTLNSLPTWGAAQLQGGLSFDGGSTYVEISNQQNFNFGIGDFTLSAWAKIMDNPSNLSMLIAKNLAGACCDSITKAYAGYYLGLFYGSIVLRMEDTARSYHTVQTGVPVAPYLNAWHLYTGVRKAGVAYLYIDGALMDSSTTNLTAGYNINNPYPLALGACIYWTTNGFFKGSLDEARIYNRALTAAEIQSLYAYAVNDNTPPIVNHGLPNENLLCDVTDTVLSVTTNENAVCKYSTTPNIPFAAMTSNFTTTGKKYHTTRISGLRSGESYNYCVRCQDFAGNADVADYRVSFAVWPKPDSFRVYQALIFKNMPDFAPYGIKPSTCVYQGELWTGSTTDFRSPCDSCISKRATALVTTEGFRGPIQLDVEEWQRLKNTSGQDSGVADQLDVRRSSRSLVDSTLALFLNVLNIFKQTLPQSHTGYYGVPPIGEYLTIANNNPDSIAAWKAADDYLDTLSKSVDAFYPSLYTFYTNQADWVKVARAQVSEAKRISLAKPVYPYIWPQYHEGGQFTNHPYVDHDYWKLELETLKSAGANGVVIWGGFQEEWSDTLGWWRATKEFMSELSNSVMMHPTKNDHLSPQLVVSSKGNSSLISVQIRNLGRDEPFELYMVDVKGRMIRRSTGTRAQSVVWPTAGIASGIYFISLKANEGFCADQPVILPRMPRYTAR